MVPRLTGLNKYIHKTRAQKDQIKQGATNFVRAHVKAMLKELVLNTPQWSGDLAASWRIDLHYMPAEEHRRSEAYDWQELIGRASFKGDTAAWKEALKINEPWLKAIRYNAKINIVNVNPIAAELATAMPDDPLILGLRPGNYIPGDVMAILQTAQKFKLGNNVTGMTLKGQLNYDD